VRSSIVEVCETNPINFLGEITRDDDRNRR